MIESAAILLCYLFSSYCFAKKLDPNSKSTWLVTLFSLVVISAGFLGIFNIFNKPNIAILGLIYLSASLIFVIKTGFRLPKLKKKISMSYVLLLILFLIVALFNIVAPLSEIDSIAYHLPIATQIIKTEGIWKVFHAGYTGPNTYFPATHELIQAFLIQITGKTSLNFIITFLGLILFFTSLKDLAKKKVNDILIFFSLMAALSTPFLFQQLLNYQVDLFLFCLFGSTVALTFSSILNNNKKDIAKAFLILGLAIGTKYNGLAQTVVLIPIFVITAIHLKKMLKTILWLPALTVLTGGFFYIRNFFVADNPIYPFGINLGFLNFEGHKRFLEDMENSSILHFIKQNGLIEVIEKIKSNPDFASLLGKTSLFLILLFLILITVVFLKTAKLKQKESASLIEKSSSQNIVPKIVNGGSRVLKKAILLFICLFYLFIGELFSYINSPYTFTLWNETIRYSSAIFALIPIGFVLCAYYFKKLSTVMLIFLITIAGYNFLSKSFVFNENYIQLFKNNDKDLFLSQELGGYKELLPFIKELRKREKTNIALAGLTHYGLFEQEGFTSLYINIDGCIKCKYPDYRNEKNSVRSYPNEQKWKEALKILDIKYLLAGNIDYHSADSALFEKKWADQDKNMFTEILKTDRLSLYEIK